MKQLKDNPKIEDFVKEALELNSLLSMQHATSCQMILVINLVCKECYSMMN